SRSKTDIRNCYLSYLFRNKLTVRCAPSYRPQLQRLDRGAIAHVQTRSYQSRDRPRLVCQYRRAGVDLQAAGRRRCQGQRPVLVQEDQLPVGGDEVRPREAALLPCHVARAHVDGDDEGGAEVAARAVDAVPEADGGPEVDAHLRREPPLLDRGAAVGLGKVQDTAAPGVGGGHEEQVAVAPDRRADVQPVLRGVRMVPVE